MRMTSLMLLSLLPLSRAATPCKDKPIYELLQSTALSHYDMHNSAILDKVADDGSD